ncbi:MAG: hypothetical protein LC731_06275 [Acidobacteria bacterium]|nr:hypothetical protein [Acidobacteriota bacterium]
MIIACDIDQATYAIIHLLKEEWETELTRRVWREVFETSKLAEEYLLV